MNDKLEQAKQKAKIVRVRTWTLTLMIIGALVFYLFVNLAFKSKMNVIDFVFLVIIQVIVHCLYFPDGELSGQKNELFINNKKAYNDNATKINTENKQERLREYCIWEYEERKTRYIGTECGKIGISIEELDMFRDKTAKEILQLEDFKYTKIVGEKEIEVNLHFNASKRHRLYKLLFVPIPVEKNEPESIMSALEYDARKSIKDESITFKVKSYISKFGIAVIAGLFFAYIGYKLKDGITIADVFQIFMYISTMFSTAVMSFSSGEVCQKVYKKNFYTSLTVFINGFFEWESKMSK